MRVLLGACVSEQWAGARWPRLPQLNENMSVQCPPLNSKYLGLVIKVTSLICEQPHKSIKIIRSSQTRLAASDVTRAG